MKLLANNQRKKHVSFHEIETKLLGAGWKSDVVKKHIEKIEKAEKIKKMENN